MFMKVLTLHFIVDKWGEAKEMKKALPCDTLSASAMIHRHKTGVH